MKNSMDDISIEDDDDFDTLDDDEYIEKMK
jgi:hypothetical protein